MTATAAAQLFDPNVTSSPAGDLWLGGIATATPDPTMLDRLKIAALARVKAISGAANVASTKASSQSKQASSGPSPVYLQPGESATITVTITPSGGVKQQGHRPPVHRQLQLRHG